jgi:RNA polymerase sigma factor (sigma-70 family)
VIDQTQFAKWTDVEPVTVEALLEHFEGLIRHIAYTMARDYKLGDEATEDLAQSIRLKLLTFPEESRPYEGYVKVAITRAAIDALKPLTERGATGLNKIPLRERAFKTLGFRDVNKVSANLDKDDSDDTMMDWLENQDIENAETEVLQKLMAEDYLKQLNEQQRLVLSMYFGLDGLPATDSLEEVASALRMPHGRALTIFYKALRHLKREEANIPVRETKARRRLNASSAGTDLTGKRNGRVTFVKRIASSHSGGVMWLLRCDCGNERTVLAKEARRLTYCSFRCRLREKVRVPAAQCKNGCGEAGAFYSKSCSGDFCSRQCARTFATKAKRAEINARVSAKLKGIDPRTFRGSTMSGNPTTS